MTGRDDELTWQAIRTAQMCKDGKPIRLHDEIKKALAAARAEEREEIKRVVLALIDFINFLMTHVPEDVKQKSFPQAMVLFREALSLPDRNRAPELDK